MASSERLARLAEQIQSDPGLRAQLNAADPEERRRLLEAAGFGDITQDDFNAYLGQSAPGLSDTQLEQLAGGGSGMQIFVKQVEPELSEP